MAKTHEPSLDQYVFVFQDADEELLLVLALLSRRRRENQNPTMTADQMIHWLDVGLVPDHPSITARWQTHGKLVRALRRLRARRLVRDRENVDGARVWNLTGTGWIRLGDRMAFEPRRAKAA
jgi:hypothetical protein